MTSRLFISQVLEEIKQRTSIVQYIADEYGVIMSASGNGQYVTNCIMPDHRDSDPSFTANDDKGLFRCWGCGVAGDIVSLVMKVEGLKFTSAVRKLALYSGVPISDNDGAILEMSARALVKSLDQYLNDSPETEALPVGMDINEFCFAFATRMRAYEREVDGDTEWVDGIYLLLDDMISKDDFDACGTLWRALAKRMKERREEINHE